MHRTRVKICGITREVDAQAAIRAGADALGFVFYPPSPRAVTVEQAAAIIRALPPFITTVGLFVNAARAEVAETVRRTGLDLLQFHGDEAPADCEGFARPYIRAIRMKEGVDLRAEETHFAQTPSFRGLLLDAYRPGIPGGTGESFDWGRIPAGLAGRIVLAGGLEAGNIEQAITQVHPFAVDVSGGVEADKGIKDDAKIQAFVRGVERADRND